MHVDYVDVPDHPGNKVVAIHFDGWVWGKEPYTYNGCPYFRRESTTKQMPREMFEERLKAAKPHVFGWENQIAEEFAIEDLNEKSILNAVRLGVRGGRMPEDALSLPIDELLRHFSLLKDGKPIQAAVALFCKNLYYYPQLLLRMARFKGNDKSEFIDNQRAQGNFFELLDAGMAFCFKHLNLHGKVVGLQRQEYLDIPVEALREALINSLCHRSYDSVSASVSLAIYDNRVEIENPGRLPMGITPENIKLSHDSKPFNPIMASVLYKTTWLESWGSGVGRMCDACKTQGVPEPYYEERPGGVVIVFRKRTSATENHRSGENDFDSDFGSQLTERQKVIYDEIKKDGQVTAKSLAITLAGTLAISQRTIEREMTYLRENGYIKKEGKKNKGIWIALK